MTDNVFKLILSNYILCLIYRYRDKSRENRKRKIKIIWGITFIFTILFDISSMSKLSFLTLHYLNS